MRRTLLIIIFALGVLVSNEVKASNTNDFIHVVKLFTCGISPDSVKNIDFIEETRNRETGDYLMKWYQGKYNNISVQVKFNIYRPGLYKSWITIKYEGTDITSSLISPLKQHFGHYRKKTSYHWLLEEDKCTAALIDMTKSQEPNNTEFFMEYNIGL